MFFFIKNKNLHGPYELQQIKSLFENNVVNEDTKFFMKTDDRLKPVNMSSMVPAQKEVVVINQTKPQVVQEPVSVPPPPAVLARPKSTTPPVPKRKLVKANSKPKSNNFGKPNCIDITIATSTI